MATFLYRLGRFSYRSRRLVGLIWLAVVVGVGAGAATLSGATSDSFSIPGTESQEAFDLLAERFPDAALDGATARVVFVAPEGETFDHAQIEAMVGDVLGEIAQSPQVAQVESPYQSGLISEDGTMGLAHVTYQVPFIEIEEETREALFAAAESGRSAGLTVELGGDAIETEPELGSELLGLGVAAMVLIITFGSLVSAGMPLVTGVTGVVVGIAAITAAPGFVEAERRLDAFIQEAGKESLVRRTRASVLMGVIIAVSALTPPENTISLASNEMS
jgi:RND superfamily putative drug exporter